jgi:hypothetical protein
MAWAIPLSFMAESLIGSSGFIGSRRAFSGDVVTSPNTRLTPASRQGRIGKQGSSAIGISAVCRQSMGNTLVKSKSVSETTQGALSDSFSLPPLPWRHMSPGNPQAFLGFSCFLLQPFKHCISWRILPIPPAPAVFDQRVIDVGAIRQLTGSRRLRTQIAWRESVRKCDADVAYGPHFGKTLTEDWTRLRGGADHAQCFVG